MLLLWKINLFPPLIYNCSCDEVSANTDSELPLRRGKKASQFYPFSEPSLFIMPG